MNVCCHADKKIMYWFKIKLEKTEGVIKNGQSRRHRQHWTHKTQDEDKQSKKTQQIKLKDEQHGPH